MHPTLLYELARLKIADAHADAARHRRVREATGHAEPSIDMARVASRIRAQFTRSRSIPNAPAAAGA